MLEDDREASRPEAACGDDVALGREEGDVDGQVDEGEETDHEPEGAVDVACVLERVSDVVAAEHL